MHRLQNTGRSARAPNGLSTGFIQATNPPSAAWRVGRFAPTPSGDLHIGSLVAAVASAADIKHREGAHRVRIDDIDPPREVPGSTDRILHALVHFALPMDGPVIRQSEHLALYQEALDELIKNQQVFACTCSRKSLQDGQLCVASCHTKLLSVHEPVNEQLKALRGEASVRLNTASLSGSLVIKDEIQPNQYIDDVTKIGTPVIWRKDGYVSYLLATAVDDSNGITDVVRGADLWAETPAQQLVMDLLNRSVPQWAHVPCAVDEQNHKLGKQTRAASVHEADPLVLVQKVWQFLGQAPQVCGSLEEFWHNAAITWDREAVPQVLTQRIE